MTMRMLIDARHPEETRVAVIKGNRIEEFDFESAEHKQLKGNIYLAKVTRVEPSLQAAFVDYGGNRHGFLAFSEIHPDYYQIPKEDREALLREEAEHAAEEAQLRAAEIEREEDGEGGLVEVDDVPMSAEDDEEGGEESAAPVPAEEAENGSEESAAENLRRRRQALRRRYKIQDVIRRRQVLLVQVVKEERGNKGAALTTYLSLAGRYCVLMPNTSHGGGISRKISNGTDRKRLKQIMADLRLPSTMGLIVRTAGLSRTKTEIKRDFDYLARLWDEIRDKTLHSSAPALIYLDSDLIKRAIRDIYNRDIDEVIVEGDEGYRDARAFMKLLMPSHVRRVKQYVDPVPLFQRYGAEDQLSAMYQPVVQLKSGGYVVINPTEALVSIDINSGRSTREHNIEQTAFQTNLEAAHEIARQLRLRDMAGLVVIDFIDMESSGHIRKVEKAMKEALKNDRARIQVGRISSFGLLEMSRQRLRTGVLEASTRPCPHCEGTGLMRTASSAGLSALRMLEDEAARGRGSRIVLRAGREAAVYLLNRKRDEIVDVERRYGVTIEVLIEESFESARMTVESLGPPPAERPRAVPIAPVEAEDEEELPEEEEEEEPEAEDERDEEEAAPRGPKASAETHEEREGRRRRRRRGRRGGRRRDREGEPSADETMPVGEPLAAAAPDEEAPAEPAPVEDAAPIEEAEPAKKTRRRPRARKREAVAEETVAEETSAAPTEPAAAEPVAAEIAPEAAAAEPAAKPKRTRRRKTADVAEAGGDGPVPATEGPAPAPEAPKPAADAAREAANDSSPARRTRAPRKVAPAPVAPEPEPATPAETNEREDSEGEGGSPRRGWWQRTFGA
ncbi:ribonuclease E/G [Sphingosinicella sp. CPCC 101087]|uniref:Rne/Rng family ribonuclease n=1 Tax=Sphingosinicella sp. CPCC 101087 TaxID=2497754 RepID=UPI00197DCC65|nr:ribonuclease E/G [Sphingosinicella sp. CPCC 101087]